MIDTKPGPGEATEPEGQREEGDGGAAGHDQGSQGHEQGLAEVSAACEKLPDVGRGQLPVCPDGVRQVARDLDHHRHQDVGERGEEAGRIEAVAEDVAKEHWEAGQEGVEAPVLGEVCDDDGPDGAGGQHRAPRRGRVTHLPLR